MAGYRAKKRLGQNFLHDQHIISRTLDLLPASAELPIIEIGPGQGALTMPIAATGRPLVAVEFDRDLIGALEKKLQQFPHASVIQQDFLTYEPAAKRFFLIGNIPYNLTSPVIDWCVRHVARIERVILMVQRELAERLAAEPGNKAWSPLSIFSQLHYRIEHRFDVPPSAFRPKPAVTSSVITLDPAAPTPIPDYDLFHKVVTTAFTQRRKLLVNNLSPAIVENPDDLRTLLEEMDLKPTARAEELSIRQFLALTKHLVARNLV